MHLLQAFIPVRDNHGKPFPTGPYTRIRRTLTEEFGGVTVYTHVPAKGLWKDNEDGTQQDDQVIFEALVAKFDKSWWRKYKSSWRK